MPLPVPRYNFKPLISPTQEQVEELSKTWDEDFDLWNSGWDSLEQVVDEAIMAQYGIDQKAFLGPWSQMAESMDDLLDEVQRDLLNFLRECVRFYFQGLGDIPTEPIVPIEYQKDLSALARVSALINPEIEGADTAEMVLQIVESRIRGLMGPK